MDYKKLACHLLLSTVWAGIFLNILLLCHVPVQSWALPLGYGIYALGIVGWRWQSARLWPTKKQILGWLVIVALLGAAAFGLAHLYDTSWDGQDYQQSGVIALRQGWNPWYQAHLPIQLPQSTDYVVGYPKFTWLLQAGIYAFTGSLQSAVVTNVIAAVIAGLLAYGALRSLQMGRSWSVVITILAVAEVHFMQQLPTFMQDGLSYVLSLASIALLILLARKSIEPWLGSIAFIALWIWLAGSKFNNLLICLLLGLAFIGCVIVNGWYRQRWLVYMAIVTFIGGSIALGVPYGTNLLRFGSPLYPQNLPGASNKLLEDNLPVNIKHDNRLQLLFYGIFSHIQSGEAGSPSHPQNVATLKIPFTFEAYELQQQTNFQGRVGSAGLLFSGVLVLAVTVFGAGWICARHRERRAFVLSICVIGLILGAALFIPVANKLRYSPLVTLLPLLFLLPVLALAQRRRWFGAAAVLVLAGVALNAVLAFGVFVAARLHEVAVINTQAAQLRQTQAVYAVHADHLYSSYIRLQQQSVATTITPVVQCAHPVLLEYTNWTTHLCPESTR